MEYYYTHKKNISGSELLITDSEAHHLKNVLRKKIGDEVYITDGERNVFKVKIISIEKEFIRSEILERFFNLNEPERNTHLFLSLLKNPSRFEFAIEKCVEIGVNEITPMITEHVINKKSDKQERWQAIALAAMKQSQRCFLPKINAPISFSQFCKTNFSLSEDEKSFTQIRKTNFSLSKNSICLLADERSNETLDLKSFSDENIFLFIGPEGGFSIEELELAKKNNFTIFSLGKRKLRSETAAIVGVNNILL